MSSRSFKCLTVEVHGAIALVGLNRPQKRNAINDDLLGDVHAFFSAVPEDIRVVVLHGHGEHFCSGLDLSEHSERDAFAVMMHSQAWHRAFGLIQSGRTPVVAALHGAVVGGGLELAAATHVRVADRGNTFYALPEGQRGIYVGGGASVRVAGIIGAGRMAEMMLTGRSYAAEEGQGLGLSHHLAEPGRALDKAMDLAGRIATNAPLSNFAILQALPRIADMSAQDGLFTESLMAALVQTSGDAQERMRAFLEKRAGKAGA